MESFDLEDFKYNNVNITAFRLVDIQNKRVTDVSEQMKIVRKNSGLDVSNDNSLMQVNYSFGISYFEMKNYANYKTTYCKSFTFIKITSLSTIRVTG